MSQDFHQNIFSFSNGFDRSEQQIRSDKATAAPQLVAMEEDGYEGGGGIFSEMFGFSSGTATELLEAQLAHPRAAEWFLHRHSATAGSDLGNSKNPSGVNQSASYNHHEIDSINADSAAAMQLFAINPSQRSPPPPLQTNPSPSFHGGGAFGQFTWRPYPSSIVEGQGQGLSLSLSSSAEELRQGLLFNHGGGTPPPPQYHRFGGGGALAPNFTLSNSKYAKAAQELLEEFCSVGRDQFNRNKRGGGAASTAAAEDSPSSSKDPPPLSASERLEHQRRKVKLSAMLDEASSINFSF